MRILNRHDVRMALDGGELAVLSAVQTAYVMHAEGQSQIPLSTFLRPPDKPDSRIIALPAYLGGKDPVIGLKWISSFPGNVHNGMQRAASVSILNDLESGYPLAVMESSGISAARTAASAALASHVLQGPNLVHSVGLIGCGTINHKTIAYLAEIHPEIRRAVLFDVVAEHAEISATTLGKRHPQIAFRSGSLADVLRTQTVSIATTDSSYWLDLDRYPDRPKGQVILHVSLRDLSTDTIRGAYNVVDDPEHVCQKETSLHKVAQELGHRGFIHATIGDLISGRTAPRRGDDTVVFSPFGLGILDLAVCAEVLRAADTAKIGIVVDGFDPGSHDVTSLMLAGVKPTVHRLGVA